MSCSIDRFGPAAWLVALLLAGAAPAAAQDANAPDALAGDPVEPALPPDDSIEVTATAISDPLTARERSVPAQLSPAMRSRYRELFQAIARGRLTAAREMLAAMPPGILHATAEAQLLIAQGPGAGLTRLVGWLEANPDAPQARTIAALARRAGATDLPPLARARELVPVRLTPPLGPRGVRHQSSTDATFAAEARARIAANDPAAVETLLDRYAPELTAEVKSEWAQRAAWDAYLDLDDGLARRLAARAADGQGEWAAQGHWTAGLASFRQNDCEGAARHFDAVGQAFAAPDHLRAAAAFWAARAHVRCERPYKAAERLRQAVARDRDGFYGLLAARQLGITPNLDWREPDFIQADWTTLSSHAGARRAAALAEIGENGLADRELRHLAATTAPDTYEPILRLAARLDLPATQYWLAQNPPAGQMSPMSARFPTPEWQPTRGWRVDRGLVFAHALQESKFITTARSGAGAQGVMQIMPGTARDIARAIDLSVGADSLADPAFNVEFGQAYLEMLRDSPHTGGLLPKVIAAYNAGPGSVMRWNNGGVRDNGDALLFIESIPFRETRHYVGVVLRNFWMYQMKEAAGRGDSAPPPSLTVLATNRWPLFPPASPR